jgi:hypothetical protein
MMVTLLILAPAILAVLSAAMWFVFRRNGWSRPLSLTILIGTIASVSLYMAGYVGSLIGDRVYGGGEQFAWGRHYAVTLPLMLAGWLGSLGFFIAAVVGSVLTLALRNRRRQR